MAPAALAQNLDGVQEQPRPAYNDEMPDLLHDTIASATSSNSVHDCVSKYEKSRSGLKSISTTTVYVTVTITHLPSSTMSFPEEKIASPTMDNYTPQNESLTSCIVSPRSPRSAGGAPDSPSSCVALQSFTAPTTTTWLQNNPPRRSSYPRPSPPLFLYPQPIVPRSSAQHIATQPTKMSFLFNDTATGLLPDILPSGAIYILYALIAIGFAWSTIVYWVSFPPKFLRRNEKSITPKKKKEETDIGYGHTWIWAIAACIANPTHSIPELLGWTRKPVDKPSKYAPLYDSDRYSAISTSTSTSSLPGLNPRGSRRYTPDGAIELRTRDPVALARRAAADGLTAFTPLRVETEETARDNDHDEDEDAPLLKTKFRLSRPSNQPQPSPRHLSSSSAATSTDNPSPYNPFLPPIPETGHIRSTSDWITEREAFQAVTPNASYSSLDELEAQKASQQHARASSMFSYLNGKAPVSEGGVKKTGGWLDKVDGAVNRAVDKVVKWTGDSGKDEELLLPVASC